MNKLYFDITINSTSSSYSEFMSKILSAFHGAMKCYGDNSPVAIALPKWSHNKDPNKATFGNIIRFFGDQVDLSVWSTNATLDKLEESGSISVQPINKVPENCPHVRYIRDRLIEKAKKYGNEDQILAYPPSTMLRSKSNGKAYPIRIRMEKSTCLVGLFTSFGLSNGDNPGTVPFF